MPHLSLLVLLLAGALLTGCALPPTGPAAAPVTRLVLERPVSVPEGRARVFLQDGELVKGLDEFKPHCALEIRHLSGPPRTIPAGNYPVTRVQREVVEVVFAGPGRQVAAAGLYGRLIAGTDDGGDAPADIFEGYHFWLADSADVGLMRLTCFGIRAEPWNAEPPTMAELRRVLGDYGRLETAD
jgi:hypothetical protein